MGKTAPGIWFHSVQDKNYQNEFDRIFNKNNMKTKKKLTSAKAKAKSTKAKAVKTKNKAVKKTTKRVAKKQSITVGVAIMTPEDTTPTPAPKALPEIDNAIESTSEPAALIKAEASLIHSAPSDISTLEINKPVDPVVAEQAQTRVNESLATELAVTTETKEAKPADNVELKQMTEEEQVKLLFNPLAHPTVQKTIGEIVEKKTDDKRADAILPTVKMD